MSTILITIGAYMAGFFTHILKVEYRALWLLLKSCWIIKSKRNNQLIKFAISNFDKEVYQKENYIIAKLLIKNQVNKRIKINNIRKSNYDVFFTHHKEEYHTNQLEKLNARCFQAKDNIDWTLNDFKYPDNLKYSIDGNKSCELFIMIKCEDINGLKLNFDISLFDNGIKEISLEKVMSD